MAFVIEEDFNAKSQFAYDADSQILTIKLTGNTEHFILDKGEPSFDALTVRDIERDNSSYIGSNAYGAKTEVHSIFAEQYGIIFSEHNWLLRTTEEYHPEFSYALAMTPEEARALKLDGKLLLVCSLESPWSRHSATGHKATIDNPYETTIGQHYLQVSPEQLWVFNSKTGEVFQKLTAAIVAAKAEEQLQLTLQQTPILLEVFSPGIQSIRVACDDDEPKTKVLVKGRAIFKGKHIVTLTLEHPRSLSDVQLTLNGKSYHPEWRKDSSSSGSYEYIRSATAVITVP